MTPDVLVVGAGPVGLVLACELLTAGVPVRLVDAERAPTPHSRANVVWPRNLELLRRIGVTSALLDSGHRVGGVTYYSNRRHLGTAWLNRLDGTPFPFALMIPQNRTEDVLRQRFAELGGWVERGVRLTGLTGTDVALTHPDGTVEQTSPGWVVGADGAHSTVRKELGIGFDGEPVDVSFAIADARITGAVRADRSYYCYSPRGGLALGPLGDDVYRIAVTVPHEVEAPPASLFREVVADRAPGRNVVGDPLWSTTFRVRCRIAATFRSGRCFLVGDAAHIVSPAGGQGMNTGIQDAVNLGWRLAGVARGTLPAAALDGYDAERRPAAHRVAASTAAATRFGLARNGFQRAVRDFRFRARYWRGDLQREVAPQLSQVDVTYGAPPVDGVVAVGGRLPVLLGDRDAGVPGWPVVAADRNTVLLWSGSGAWGSPPEGAQVVPPGVAPAVARALGPESAVLVVRPDGHLAQRLDPVRWRETGVSGPAGPARV